MIGGLTKFRTSMNATTLRCILNWWPPNIGAGIRTVKVDQDFKYAKVIMPLKWYNRNYVGAHFGGSLYSMCDPWYMLLLMNALGPEFIVWDKGAKINYVKPGRTTVSAEFFLDDDLLNSLRQMGREEKRVFDLPVDVKDCEGDVVAALCQAQGASIVIHFNSSSIVAIAQVSRTNFAMNRTN